MLRSGRRVNEDGKPMSEEAGNLKGLVGRAETILKENCRSGARSALYNPEALHA